MTRPDLALELDSTSPPRAPDRTNVPGPDPAQAALVRAHIQLRQAEQDYIRVSAALADAQRGREREKAASFWDGFACGGVLIGAVAVLVLLMWVL